MKSRQTRIDLVTRPPLTQTGEKTALFCLAQHDWKLDLALDNYFANPEGYYKEPKSMIDRKKIETLYTRYRGTKISHHYPHLCTFCPPKPLRFW